MQFSFILLLIILRQRIHGNHLSNLNSADHVKHRQISDTPYIAHTERKKLGDLHRIPTSHHPPPSPNCFPHSSILSPSPHLSPGWLHRAFWPGVAESSVSSDSPLLTVRLTPAGPVTATRKQAPVQLLAP